MPEQLDPGHADDVERAQFSASGQTPPQKSWLQRNLVPLVCVLLALVGLALGLIGFLQPCDKTLVPLPDKNVSTKVLANVTEKQIVEREVEREVTEVKPVTRVVTKLEPVTELKTVTEPVTTEVTKVVPKEVTTTKRRPQTRTSIQFVNKTVKVRFARAHTSVQIIIALPFAHVQVHTQVVKYVTKTVMVESTTSTTSEHPADIMVDMIILSCYSYMFSRILSAVHFSVFADLT